VADQPPQSDEERWLHDFFDHARSGFFVEVGLRQPARGSKTWPLEAAGWTGVLVEPQPEIAAFLATARSAKVFAVGCVAADQAGELLPLRIETPLSSIDVGQGTTASPSNYVIMVPTRTLDDILREAEAPAPLDLLAVDVHGRELDTLLGFDFERWQPRLILIADPVVNLQRHRFLKESGYRLVRRFGGRGWYVPAGSLRGRGNRWPVVRDYYLALPFRMARHALRRLKTRILASAK
jgi:FkbM family methyltransferase